MNEWRNFPTRAGDMFSGRLTLPEHGYPLRGSERNTDARHSLSRDFPETFPPGHIRSSVSLFGTDDPASIDWSQKLADPASLMSGAQIDEQIVNRFDGNPPRDRMGRPLSGEQADSVVARWPEKVREMSPDARDIAFSATGWRCRNRKTGHRVPGGNRKHRYWLPGKCMFPPCRKKTVKRTETGWISPAGFTGKMRWPGRPTRA